MLRKKTYVSKKKAIKRKLSKSGSCVSRKIKSSKGVSSLQKTYGRYGKVVYHLEEPIEQEIQVWSF